MNLSDSLFKIAVAAIATGGGITFTALANLNGDSSDFMNLVWFKLVFGGYLFAVGGGFIHMAARRQSNNMPKAANWRLITAAIIFIISSAVMSDAIGIYSEKVLQPLEASLEYEQKESNQSSEHELLNDERLDR